MDSMRGQTELLSEEEGRTTETLRKELREFRALIRSGDFPDDLLGSLAEVHASFPEGTSLRCRSSTNNEDLPGFSGAGLYDSCTHRIEEGHIAKSIKQVFASLWNFRAVQEREFYRIDHMLTAMGVLIHPNMTRRGQRSCCNDRYSLPDRGSYYLNTRLGKTSDKSRGSLCSEELLLDWFDAGKTKVMRRSNQTKGELILSAKHLEKLRESLASL